MASPDRLEAAFEPLLCLHRLRLLQLGLVELKVLPTTLPSSCELMIDMNLRLRTQLHPWANLTELCLVTAASRSTFFRMDKLPCLPRLRKLVVKANWLIIHWHESAALPMLQSLKCVGNKYLKVQLGSELHHIFTGQLFLATSGELSVMHTDLQSWYGESSGLHSGMCNSLASFCALGSRRFDKPIDKFDNHIILLANAKRLDGGREWTPKLGRINAHGIGYSNHGLEVLITDAEGLEWVSTQYKAICHSISAPFTPMRNVDIEWDC